MKNILLPTDFSESANKATDLGLEIAGKTGAGVTFLHLLSTPVEWSKLPLDKEKLYPETKAAIGDARDKLMHLEKRAEERGVDALTSLVFNIGIDEIDHYINKENYSLVIMGTHGKKGKNRYAGTNTLEVIHKSPIPVLVVKANSNSRIPEKWIVVSDFLKESKPEFDLIITLAKELNASIETLYINTPYFFVETPDIESRLEIFTGQHKDLIIKNNVVSAYNEERGIAAFTGSRNFDLIVLITHGRRGLNPVFRRSITEKVMNHVDIPVMSVNSNE